MNAIRLARTAVLALCVAVLAACSTTQDVMLVKGSGAKKVGSVVQKPEEGNSSAMDLYVREALEKRGVSIKGAVPAGVQKTKDADAVIGYIDVWRWDLVMYLQRLSVRLYDAETGDLVVVGNWADSPMHGFRDARLVVDGLVQEMLDKVKSASGGQ